MSSTRKTKPAKFNRLGRDLFWSLYDLQDGYIRWTGYDDEDWWRNVAPSQREKAGPKTGRVYRIDFETCTVEVAP